MFSLFVNYFLGVPLSTKRLSSVNYFFGGVKLKNNNLGGQN
jgi:hypothetical protein